MRENDSDFVKSFSAFEETPVFHRYYHKGCRIRYVEKGSDTLPVVLFIHGAPSSLSFWKGYFKDSLLSSEAKVVAVDRPGYGYSGFGRLYLSYYKQARLLQPMIEKYGSQQRLYLVGSSYGGPLAALLAAQNPHLVDGVVMISSSIAPGEEAIWNITKVIDSPIGEFFPHVLQVATAEKLNHRHMLEEIEEDWKRVRCPVIMMHGTLDDLIYPSNVDFVMNRFANAPKRIAMFGGLKHNIAYGHSQQVINKISQLIKETAPLPN